MLTSQAHPRKGRGILLHCVLLLTIAVEGKSATPTPLSATLANATVPPGGTAQLQFFLASPGTFISGSAIINLDPAIFGAIAAADVYSATGDQVGTANVTGQTVDIEFTSQTGGVGRVPSLPILTITVPILSTATPGATSTPTLKPGTTAWSDIQGVQYSPTLVSGSITVGGALSIQSVQPAGTTVVINGTGFSSGATVQIDGLAITSTQFLSAQQLQIALAQAADLAGHRITVQNPTGPPVTDFYSLHGDFSQRPSSGPWATLQPIFPSQLYVAANSGSIYFQPAPIGIALQNPTLAPVRVVIGAELGFTLSSPTVETAITLQPGASYLQSAAALGSRSANPYEVYITPDAPIRMAVVGPSVFNAVTSIPVPTTQVEVIPNGTAPTEFLFGQINWIWTAGAPAPSPMTLAVTNPLAVPFTVSAATTSGGKWLTVSPPQGTTCVGATGNNPTNCSPPSLVTISANPAGLSPGTYSGTVTFLPQAFNPSPKTVSVTIAVYANPTIFADQTSVSLSRTFGHSLQIHLTSSADPLAFTTAASTKSGQNWLSVTQSQGQTPATMTVAITPDALNTVFTDTGTITINGPNNSITLPVSASTVPVTPPACPPFGTVQSSLTFSAPLGQPPPAPQALNVAITCGAFTLSSQTTSGGNWLSVVLTGLPGVQSGLVSVNPAGLAPGTYQGKITVVAPMAPQPIQVPVTLVVWTGTPPPVAVSSSALTFSAIHGTAAASQSVNVSTGTLPLLLTVTAATTDGAAWLKAIPAVAVPLPAYPATPVMTPETVAISADATNLSPGSYSGSVTLTAPTGSTNSVTVPVTFAVQPTPPPPPPAGTTPLTTTILNGASQAPGALAPGEILTIFGQNFGPAVPAGLILTANKVATSNNGVQVFFDNVAAPLLYVSATQINAIVPYEITSPSTSIALHYNGTTIAAGSYAVTSSAPAIFTLNSAGQGPAAVLNQDTSLNSAGNPAARGSVIQIYATGAGVTQPASVTGSVAGGTGTQPALPVSVTIGGISAAVTYAAEAPGEVSGVLQVNAVVPQSLVPGSTIPVVLKVGSAQSQTGAFIAIK